jgi:hypothetical protein
MLGRLLCIQPLPKAGTIKEHTFLACLADNGYHAGIKKSGNIGAKCYIYQKDFVPLHPKGCETRLRLGNWSKLHCTLLARALWP